MSNYLSSVKNSCQLLKLFLDGPKEMGVSELSRHLDLSKGSVHNLLVTLESEGFIMQNPINKQYSLGYKLIELGNKVIKDHDLADFVKPYLKKIATSTQELVCLCIRDGKEAIYIDKIDSLHPIRFNVEAFRRFPLYATSASRIILASQEEAFIDEVLQGNIRTFTKNSLKTSSDIKDRLQTARNNGYEYSSNLRNEGVTGVAAPIFNANGIVNASISVIGPTDRMNPLLEKIIQEVVETTKEISFQLGHR